MSRRRLMARAPGAAVSVYMDGGHVAQNQCRALRPQGHAAGHPAPAPGPLHRPPPGDHLPALDGQPDAGRRGRYRHLPAAREHVGLPAGTHAVSRRGDAGRHRCRDLSGAADAAVRADGRSHRSAEAGQYAQRRDVDLSHAARALHRLAADGLLQDGAEGTGGAGADRRCRPLWRHDPGYSSPLHARLHFRRHLRLHAGAERVPLRAALSQPFERANRADRSRGRADPGGRLLLGPADGRGAAGLHSRRPHLFVLREILRRGSHRRGRQGLMTRCGRLTTGIFMSTLIGLAGGAPACAGTFVYVSNGEDGDISTYSMTPDGELQPGARAKAASVVMPMTVSPDRRFLYAASRSKPYSVHAYAIDPGTGALKLLSTSPLAESFPYISLDRTGRFLFGASYAAHLISVNAVGSDGRVAAEPLQVIPDRKSVV